MKRYRRMVGSVLGIMGVATLAIALVIALVIVLRGQQAKPQSVSQVFQSPIQTPTQTPRPTPATPSLPTPPTPRPSITPTPVFKAEAIQVIGETPLTTDGKFAGSTFGVAWSPDGNKLAFTKLTGQFITFTSPKGFAPVTDLWLANIIEQRTEKIADRGKLPVWSPDGQRLVFVSPIDEKLSQVRLFHLASQKSKRVVDNGLSAMWADSRVLAITMKGGDIRQYDRDIETLSPLTDLTATTDGPNSLAASPNGRWLVIVNDRKLWLVDRQDPQQRTLLTERFENVFGGLLWSPSGGKVAYIADRSIWIATLEPEMHSQVIYEQNGRGYPWALTWSPDGNVLAFHGPEGIAVINADGSGFRTLLPYGTTPEDSYLFPSWSPSGHTIAMEKDHNLWLLELATDRS